jgi:hypothetical protein
VSRIELGVEKQVVVNGDGQRTVVSASTDRANQVASWPRPPALSLPAGCNNILTF